MARGLGDNPFRRVGTIDRMDEESVGYDSVFYENRNGSQPEETVSEPQEARVVSKGLWSRMKRLFASSQKEEY